MTTHMTTLYRDEKGVVLDLPPECGFEPEMTLRIERRGNGLFISPVPPTTIEIDPRTQLEAPVRDLAAMRERNGGIEG